MNPINQIGLTSLARKYVWWKTPAEALEMPERVIAQVMNMGDYADVQQLAHQVGDDVLLTRARGRIGTIGWDWPASIMCHLCHRGACHDGCFQAAHGSSSSRAETSLARTSRCR